MVWQPGIRLFHSTDLANWSLVGHGLTEADHDLRGLAAHQGIWAPCLTYSTSERLFYLAYSLVRGTAGDYFDVDNFLVTAADPADPWSEPIYLNSLGFDPSFFHDDDGRHWLVTLEWDPREGYEHPGAIYRGGSDRGCLEGPHLYRRNGFYYLMAAPGPSNPAAGPCWAGKPRSSLNHRVAVDSDEAVLQLRLHQGTLRFAWRRPSEDRWHDIGPAIDASYLSDEQTRGFTGTMIGMTCIDSHRRNLWARFGYFDLRHGSSDAG